MSNCTQILQKFKKNTNGGREWADRVDGRGPTCASARNDRRGRRPRRGGRPGTAAPAPGPGRRPGSYATEAAESKPVPGGGGLDLCDGGGSENPHLRGGGGLRALRQRVQEAKSNGSDGSLSRTYGTESDCFEAPKQPVTV